MKKSILSALVSILGVIVFALVWNLTSGALSTVGAVLTLCAGVIFVVSVNRSSHTADEDASSKPAADRCL